MPARETSIRVIARALGRAATAADFPEIDRPLPEIHQCQATMKVHSANSQTCAQSYRRSLL